MNPLQRRQIFQALYERELPYVVATLRRLGVPNKELEDLAQEVFFLLYGRLEAIDHTKSIRPWLFTVCRMVAANLRRHPSQNWVADDSYLVNEVDPSPPPSQVAELEQKRAQLLQALQFLSEEQKTVFVLFDLDGVPMNQIAALQQVPLHTAYSRLKAARAELQRRLRDSKAEAS